MRLAEFGRGAGRGGAKRTGDPLGAARFVGVVLLLPSLQQGQIVQGHVRRLAFEAGAGAGVADESDQAESLCEISIILQNTSHLSWQSKQTTLAKASFQAARASPLGNVVVGS